MTELALQANSTYMLNVQQTIIVVFVSDNTVCRKVTVVDPDISGILNLDQIILLRGVVHVQIPYDHIARFLDAEPSAGQT